MSKWAASEQESAACSDADVWLANANLPATQ
jgi:hypothetical protein